MFWIISLLVHFSLGFMVYCAKTKADPTKAPPKRNTNAVPPRKFPLNEKEKMIKDGLKAPKNAYPTEEDVKSEHFSDNDRKVDKLKASFVKVLSG